MLVAISFGDDSYKDSYIAKLIKMYILYSKTTGNQSGSPK